MKVKITVISERNMPFFLVDENMEVKDIEKMIVKKFGKPRDKKKHEWASSKPTKEELKDASLIAKNKELSKDNEHYHKENKIMRRELKIVRRLLKNAQIKICFIERTMGISWGRAKISRMDAKMGKKRAEEMFMKNEKEELIIEDEN